MPLALRRDRWPALHIPGRPPDSFERVPPGLRGLSSGLWSHLRGWPRNSATDLPSGSGYPSEWAWEGVEGVYGGQVSTERGSDDGEGVILSRAT